MADGWRTGPVQVDPLPSRGYSLAPTLVLGQARKRPHSFLLLSFCTQLTHKPLITAAAVMAYNNQYQNDDYNNWDSRSAKSYNTQHSGYSTQHLNPQYNNAPPVPQLPYAQPYGQPVIDYPPMQQPQPRYGAPYDRAASIASGFTSARDKLMKRRVSTRL
jgi:hypothetical protein